MDVYGYLCGVYVLASRIKLLLTVKFKLSEAMLQVTVNNVCSNTVCVKYLNI